ncbi:hypothetical protein D3C87_1565180 [compost metagenome]
MLVLRIIPTWIGFDGHQVEPVGHSLLNSGVRVFGRCFGGIGIYGHHVFETRIVAAFHVVKNGRADLARRYARHGQCPAFTVHQRLISARFVRKPDVHVVVDRSEYPAGECLLYPAFRGCRFYFL